jgi:elongation factor Ts
MKITAQHVKELRERTGAGMMECKRALEAAGGDLDAAIEAMRKAGLAKADKKAGRIAAEGLIAIAAAGENRAAMAEVNCETDFVAGGKDFQAFAHEVADRVLVEAPADVEALGALTDSDGKSVEEVRRALIAKLGENITIRRFVSFDNADGIVGRYSHGGRIGVLVEMVGGDAALAKDLAMHIAASRPVCVRPEDVPGETVAREREIIRAQAEQSGKPPHIVEKMIGGRLDKFVGEIALIGQPFVKEPDMKVGQLLERAGAQVLRFARFEVGEGIEKQTTDFATEVMEQAHRDPPPED